MYRACGFTPVREWIRPRLSRICPISGWSFQPRRDRKESKVPKAHSGLQDRKGSEFRVHWDQSVRWDRRDLRDSRDYKGRLVQRGHRVCRDYKDLLDRLERLVPKGHWDPKGQRDRRAFKVSRGAV